MNKHPLGQMQQAIADLNAIRSAIERVESDSGFTPNFLHTYLYSLGILTSLGLLLLEAFHIWPITASLYATHYSWTLRFMAIACMGTVLGIIIIAFFGISHRQARQDGQSLKDFNARYFSSISSISFLSDLFVKFIALTVAVLSGRGDWVAPLLVIFTGDYLLQGRFFLVQAKIGTACCAIRKAISIDLVHCAAIFDLAAGKLFWQLQFTWYKRSVAE